ncbi:FAD-binding oxidoreductase [Bradyrhizobium diazoefficiens]|uniref:NAD(P)/FAD-dependent oxidoreductase n=1 Tax=Bradyrhizobium diazoefficiens TaxID=1355477 RepID=UPI00190D7A9C|nr:FAD-binding oxidoreductase [Bradyrhizobium diazoefficiens]QQO13889.1 FAD-binding oxidoreductase [Bradyrhizobium diazoefficiens]
MKSVTLSSTRSGLNALLPPRAPLTRLPQCKRFHSIVVGAGYTGLGAARRLAELLPDEEIFVLEASEVGEGASGRNSGFLGLNPSQPEANANGTARDDALRKIRIQTAGLDLLRSLVTRHGIDCDWDEMAPRICGAATAGGERSARGARESLQSWGLRCMELSGEDLKEIIGTDYYRYGYQPLKHALVQPAALVRGLAESLPANVTLLERNAVEAIEGASPFVVKTSRGDFEADKVFVANNANARELGLLNDRLFAVYTYGALTPELDDDELQRLGTTRAWGVHPPTAIGTTMRKMLRRFLIRSGYSYENESSDLAKVRASLEQLYRNRFPGMRSYDLEHVWGGAICMTYNRQFYFGEPRRGLFAAVGCGGGGVVRGSIHGKLLAEMACGSQSELLSDRLALSGPSWIPPEPFRRIGAATSMAWGRWRAGREC